MKCTQQGRCRPKEVVSQNKIVELPTYLLVKLQRFSSTSTPKVQTCVVIDSCVNIGGQSFSLLSAVEHNGITPNSGHYIAYVKDPSSGQWLKCNDSDITLVSGDNVMFNRAISYCLFSRDDVTIPTDDVTNATKFLKVTNNSSSIPNSPRKSQSPPPVTYADKVKMNHLSRSGIITDKTTTTTSSKSGTDVSKTTSMFFKVTDPSPPTSTSERENPTLPPVTYAEKVKRNRLSRSGIITDKITTKMSSKSFTNVSKTTATTSPKTGIITDKTTSSFRSCATTVDPASAIPSRSGITTTEKPKQINKPDQYLESPTKVHNGKSISSEFICKFLGDIYRGSFEITHCEC